MLRKLKSLEPGPEMVRHPCTMLVEGPTSCRKTTWIQSLKGSMIAPPLRKIFVHVFYKRWHAASVALLLLEVT